MELVSLIFGAACFGWILPEFVLMLSPRADAFRRVPMFINLLCVAGAVALAYGLGAKL
jgi:hypothetical protein